MSAFWVKNDEIIDLGYSRHINAVIDKPDRFGITKEKIKAIYKKYKEPLYSEGDAREEIVKEVSKNGWIRVREYPSYVSIQFDSYRKRKKVIQNFIFWAMYEKKALPKKLPIKLMGFEDGFFEETSASIVLSESSLFLDEKNKIKFTLIHLMEKRK